MGSASGGNRNTGPARGKHGNVVVLAECLRCPGDLLGVPAADVLIARKPQVLAAFSARLNDATVMIS